MRILAVIVGIVAGAGAWALLRRDEIASAGIVETISADTTGIADMLMELPGFNRVRIGNMRDVPQEYVDHPQVKAFLRVIRQGESSQGDEAYRMIVGGGYFSSFADHPRIFKVINGARTSAAGAYQHTATTWDETRAAMNLPDFSPRSQDIAALGRIAYRGALNDVLAGRLTDAIRKLRNEWTSLPGASEQNRLQSEQISRDIFAQFGGSIVA